MSPTTASGTSVDPTPLSTPLSTLAETGAGNNKVLATIVVVGDGGAGEAAADVAAEVGAVKATAESRDVTYAVGPLMWLPPPLLLLGALTLGLLLVVKQARRCDNTVASGNASSGKISRCRLCRSSSSCS